ncbi:heat shock factor binding protein 1 protein [Cardiosporidium cionae]|uniref:Heat shock factor binding protein 1 protein n=1 Tax=Cardiosporidium cionae TaxID=476202 RepID=A0ABQ7JCC0_9APIC|nr:heat shock factor binding protein 1 protein [Cardiosporidium cionae]|eukprot:KAF8821580.1 heat shock factor binding protein 1 protein [Cardiosporidium cionae]
MLETNDRDKKYLTGKNTDEAGSNQMRSNENQILREMIKPDTAPDNGDTTESNVVTVRDSSENPVGTSSATSEMQELLQNMLGELKSHSQSMSDEFLRYLDDMNERINDIENAVCGIMSEIGMDAQKAHQNEK